MNTFKITIPLLFAVLGVLMPGCYTPRYPDDPAAPPRVETRVDFNDPVLNSRKILLFGAINQPAAEVVIQKLLYLDSQGHEPIDLFLQTPGGELKSAFAIEEIVKLIESPLNTYGLSECNSGGAMLLAAGTGKRRVFRGAVIILHGLAVSGDPPAEFIDQIQASYTDFWRNRARLPQSWLPLPFNSTHILSAEQALEYGIVDEIIDKPADHPTLR